MNLNSNKLINFIQHATQHYNPDKYWKYRSIVTNPNDKTPKILKLWYLFQIKRSDAFNNASMGTDLNSGAKFCTPPNLPHGLNGIVISHFATIGKNCTIFHQVSIAQNEFNQAPTIGNNVLIGAGAKLIGNITIGDNINIGANAVVVHDVPSNCTVVGIPAKIVKHS